MQQRRAYGTRRALTAAVTALLAVGAILVVGTPAAAETIRDRQWYLTSLRVAQAHRLSTGKGVVVAVVDTGVQADHPDLRGQVLDGIRLVGTDDKGRTDPDGHGTGVAGLIAARGGGPNHALGIAPGAKILPVAAPIGAFGGSGLADGIRWAVDHDASVINLSVAAKRATDPVIDAVRYALDHDVVVVAASGNLATGDTEVGSPASIPGVLAVSAVDRDGRFWDGGVRGPQMGLAAPGVDMLTTGKDFGGPDTSGYIIVPGGTSAAAPVVAGAAALIRSRFPDLSARDVINRLVATSTDAGPKGRDDEYGFGRLDLVKALTADVPEVPANPLGNPPKTEPVAAGDGDAGTGPDLALLIAAAVGVAVLVLVIVGLVVVLAVYRRRRRLADADSVRPVRTTPQR